MKGRKAAGLSVLVIIYIITILNIVHIFRSIDKDVDFASMENVLSSNIAFRESFINIYGLFEKVSGVNIIDDKENGYIIKQDNGHLLWVGVTKQIIQETVVRLDHMLKVREYLEQQGIDSLYVQTPSKNSADEMNLPYGVHDYLIEMQDSQISYLREHGMKILDLREEFAKKGYSLEEVFFKTDHHWKPLYAFYANEIIADYMRGLGFLTDEEALDIKNYEVNTYRNWFLGSIGKRVGIYYAGIDDIDLIYPKFDTLLSFGMGGGKNERKGSFLKSMIEYSDHCNINKKDYFNINQYEAYTGGNYPFVEIRNFNPVNHKKIMIIKDSMSNTMIPFLALQCEYLTEIDLRYLTESDMNSMKTYIDEFKPDFIIFSTTLGMENSIFIEDFE